MILLRLLYYFYFINIIYGCDIQDRTIRCSELNLTQVPEQYEVLNNLNLTEDPYSLNLSINLLSNPIHFFNWSVVNLKILDLSYNKLSYVNNETFSELNNLKVLNLSHNELVDIQFSKSLLSGIEILDLSNNLNLNYTLHTLKELSQSSLIHLNLSSTKISLESVGIFSKIKSLLSLDLSNTGLSFIPDLPSNLEYLDFSKNPITYLNPHSFAEDYQLKTLLLENNKQLSEVKYSSFDFLVKLERLSFRGCSSLSHLPTALFLYNSHLQHLSLASCNFTNITIAFKTAFLSLKTIELNDNPWHCGLQIKWFNQLHDHHILSDDIRCATPENISLAEYLGPKVKHKVVRILLTITSIILFCLLITAIVYSCNMENKRRKTLNSYSQLERTSKPYRGSLIYVTSSV